MPETVTDADTSKNANAGDNANGSGADIDAKINRAIVNHLGRFEKKIAGMLEQNIGGVIEKQLEAMAQAAIADASPEAKQPKGGNADGEAKSMKALQEKYDAKIAQMEQQFTAKFQASEKARQEAERAAEETALRSSVQAQLAKHLGAESPHLTPYMASLFDVGKRFGKDAEGKPALRKKGEFGEEWVSLDQGVKELFDGELKHLITSPSKAGGLPPANQGQPRGNPYQQNGNQPQQKKPYNPFLATVATAISESRPEVGAQLLAAAGEPNK